MFSVRQVSSMIVPFVMPFLMEHFGMKHACFLLALSAFVGQYLFILGLQYKNYSYCLFSRLVFGVSDSLTILQQTVLCLWFTNSQLPIAFSLMLFMMKMVRAINDNTASLIYNEYHSLQPVFWIGLAVCFASLVSTVALVQIHAHFKESTT